MTNQIWNMPELLSEAESSLRLVDATIASIRRGVAGLPPAVAQARLRPWLEKQASLRKQVMAERERYERALAGYVGPYGHLRQR